MGKKITYLLGAGASAGISKAVGKGTNKDKDFHRYHVVPPVNQLSKQMNKVAMILSDIAQGIENKHHLSENIGDEYLKNFIPFNYNQYLKKFQITSKNFVNQLKTISEKIKILAIKHDEFVTIDTYAKYLFLNKENNLLNELKVYFSAYLILEQFLILRKQDEFYIFNDTTYFDIDNRYLTLQLNLMNSLSFPKEDIKIFTWNYDSQFELAFLKSTGVLNYKEGSSLESKLEYNNKELKQFLYHINGIAGSGEIDKSEFSFYNSFFKNYYNQSTIKSRFNFIIYLMQIFGNSFNNLDLTQGLNFAFENDEIFKNIGPEYKDNFENHLKDTNILVIIGYSFPYFNREIDEKLLKFMKPALTKPPKNIENMNQHNLAALQNMAGKLEKIYIQEIDKEKAEAIKSRLNDRYGENVQIEIIIDGRNFHIPKEL